MCFYIKNSVNKKPKPQIAKTDILCYKVVKLVNDKIVSEHQNFEYTLGKRVRTTLGVCKYKFDDAEVHQGMHSFSTPEKANQNVVNSISRRIMHCIIPKGAKYYYNPDRLENVSTSLIPVAITEKK